MAGNNNVLADFLVNVLRRDNQQGEYLHFKVSEVLQIQNLLKILFFLVTGKRQIQNKINQTTMGLIFFTLWTLYSMWKCAFKSVREHDIHDYSGLY